MLALVITCACPERAHAAACLRSPAAGWVLRPRRAAAAPGARRLAALVVCGDKLPPKKKKPAAKHQASADESQAGAGAVPLARPPPRVDPNLNIPVRKQIVWAKAGKEASKPTLLAKREAQTKSFRRETVTPEAHKEQMQRRAAETARLSKLESKNVALSSLYGTKETSALRNPKVVYKVLLVDGYNVAHRWEETAALMASGDVEAAREKLIEALATYQHYNRVRMVVAFDAMAEVLPNGLTVAYCGDQEADSYIEAQVDHFLERGFHDIVVATSDSLHADCVRGRQQRCKPNQWCHVVPSGALINDMARTAAEIERSMVLIKGVRMLSTSGHTGVGAAMSGGGGGGGGGGSGGRDVLAKLSLELRQARMAASRGRGR